MDKQSTEKRFALLIDADNVSAKYLQPILDELSKYGTVTYKRIYGDWTLASHVKWKKVLLENSITPIQQFGYTQGKNATDSAMIIDAMDILYTNSVEGFCIVSSDSDFTRLAVRLREGGLTVIGRKKNFAVGDENSLTPVGRGHALHLCAVTARVEVVAVGVAAVNPIRHPHHALVAVDGDTRNLDLAALGSPREVAFPLQRAGIIDRHGDIVAAAILEALDAAVYLSVEDVDVAEMIGNLGMPEGRVVLLYKVALLVVFVEGARVRNVIVVAVDGYALASGHGDDGFETVLRPDSLRLRRCRHSGSRKCDDDFCFHDAQRYTNLREKQQADAIGYASACCVACQIFSNVGTCLWHVEPVSRLTEPTSQSDVPTLLALLQIVLELSQAVTRLT